MVDREERNIYLSNEFTTVLQQGNNPLGEMQQGVRLCSSLETGRADALLAHLLETA